MQALLSGYGIEASRYRELIGLMVTRSRAEHDMIVRGAAQGQQPWAKLHAEGHHRYWGSVAECIEGNTIALESMLS